MRTPVPQFICMALLLAGCSVPVTDGFRRDLPKPGTRVVVWGNDTAVVGTATTWLQRQGISVIERSLLAQQLDPEAADLTRTIDVTHTMQDEVVILRAGKKAGAEEIIFVERTGDYRAPMVLVRGLDLESGRVHWSGTARYPSYQKRPIKHALTNLTCEALATAWEFRPPGTRRLTSSEAMCEVEADNKAKR
jgi:hypothetical protein